jgi:hypothetical protein
MGQSHEKVGQVSISGDVLGSNMNRGPVLNFSAYTFNSFEC